MNSSGSIYVQRFYRPHLGCNWYFPSLDDIALLNHLVKSSKKICGDITLLNHLVKSSKKVWRSCEEAPWTHPVCYKKVLLMHSIWAESILSSKTIQTRIQDNRDASLSFFVFLVKHMRSERVSLTRAPSSREPAHPKSNFLCHSHRLLHKTFLPLALRLLFKQYCWQAPNETRHTSLHAESNWGRCEQHTSSYSWLVLPVYYRAYVGKWGFVLCIVAVWTP